MGACPRNAERSVRAAPPRLKSHVAAVLVDDGASRPHLPREAPKRTRGQAAGDRFSRGLRYPACATSSAARGGRRVVGGRTPDAGASPILRSSGRDGESAALGGCPCAPRVSSF